MKPQVERLRTIPANGFDVVIVRCFNPQGGAVYGAYVEKNGTGAYLCGGWHMCPDCLSEWPDYLYKAERIADRMEPNDRPERPQAHF